ncbi:MAG: long-chain fatty acid--CoA ligase [Bacteroidia bacterium]|nr:long-chain fatty acid--CoA ligase [Bacteroidia bacterium]
MQKVADILFNKELYSKPDILNKKVNKQWKSFSGKDFYQYSFSLAEFFIQSGLKKGDKVLLMAENCPEWNFTDFACQLIGVVTVPVFPNISEHDLNYIIQESNPQYGLFSKEKTINKYPVIKEHFQEKIISFSEINGIKNIHHIINQIGFNEQIENKIKEIYQSILPEELLTILYTSGTSGQPKGVMLSHHNLVSNILNCQHIAPFQKHWKALSFLPLNHVYERMVNSLLLYKGVSIYYAEGVETVVENIKEVKPHLFVSVPRLIERVYQKIISTRDELKGIKKHTLTWAINLAEKYELQGKNGKWYELQRKIADKIVYQKWRDALGGNLECMISGGAALNPKLERMFLCAKINCMQGYGLTETSPVVAVNGFYEQDKCIGTVGPVIPNTMVKIADDGEILVKGPGVMLGYYNNKSATDEVIDKEGWFHTGDIGEIVENRFLKITDRKKEIFKTTSGKYISPAYIESKIKEHPLIEHTMVIGANEKFASALITLNIQNIAQKFPDKKNSGIQDICGDEKIKTIIFQHIHNVNKQLAPHEQIRNPQILNTTWSVESGELTPKMSLKRKVIIEKYKDVIEHIYRRNKED